MGQVFDEADYRRRLEAARKPISTREEIGYILSSDLPGLNARKAFEDAKVAALEKAREKMLDAIERAERDHRLNGFLPTEVEEIVNGPSDELVRVDGRVRK